jgi:UDP-N-acetylmuramoyl-tripeptide--D-alanyl-D-alanine ligase
MNTIETIYNVFRHSSGVCTDTRNIRQGQFFVALRGDRFDGNDYALEALQLGAGAALVDNKLLAKEPNCWYVPNTLSALQKLAHYHRSKFHIPVFAITGSNGKTTTKELINAVLQPVLETIATRGNLNNHIGVPLTLLSISEHTEVAIIEMGANHPGEIGWLCQIAAPNMGLVTNVGLAHLEGFGTLEQTWDTKMGLYRYLESVKGVVFINEQEKSLEPLKDVFFSLPVRFSQKHLVKPAVEVNFRASGTSTEVQIISSEGIEYQSQVALYGAHNSQNILAAIIVGLHLKVPIINILQGLESYRSNQNRSQIVHQNSNTYYLDAYNANPTSMKVAIDFFKDLEVPNKVFILGDMKELGDHTLTAHIDILRAIEEMDGIEKILLVGTYFQEAANTAGSTSSISLFNNVDEVRSYLKTNPFSDRHLLLKGSRSIGLEKILLD